MQGTVGPLQSCPICTSQKLRPFKNVERSYAGRKYSLCLLQCGECDFVAIKDPPFIKYDADYLDFECPDDPLLSRFRGQERIATISSYLPPQGRKTFLDIGIGDGFLLSLAEAGGYQTYGLDINPDGFRLGQQRYGLRTEMSYQPVPQAFPDVAFHIIHMNEVIEHVSKPIDMFQWCYQHLENDGLLVVQTGNAKSVASKLKGDGWDYFRPAHVSYFSEKNMRLALTKAGFRVVMMRSVDWRIAKLLPVTRLLFKERGGMPAIRFFVTFVSTFVYGISRTMLVCATKRP